VAAISNASQDCAGCSSGSQTISITNSGASIPTFSRRRRFCPEQRRTLAVANKGLVPRSNSLVNNFSFRMAPVERVHQTAFNDGRSAAW
jgi:hypothetical protein